MTANFLQFPMHFCAQQCIFWNPPLVIISKTFLNLSRTDCKKPELSTTLSIEVRGDSADLLLGNPNESSGKSMKVLHWYVMWENCKTLANFVYNPDIGRGGVVPRNFFIVMPIYHNFQPKILIIWLFQSCLRFLVVFGKKISNRFLAYEHRN